MKPEPYDLQIEENVYEPMLTYLRSFDEDEEPGYTEEDILRCRRLLEDYVRSLCALEKPEEDAILDRVQQTVEAINELNEQTDFAMIETDEREAICQLIQSAALDCGLPDTAEDITEPWREW